MLLPLALLPPRWVSPHRLLHVDRGPGHRQFRRLVKQNHQEEVMKLFGNVMLRVVATFVASALGVIGAGSVAGSVSGVDIPIWFSAIMGGIMAVAKVVELLSLAFLEDGKLSRDEINAAFRPRHARAFELPLRDLIGHMGIAKGRINHGFGQRQAAQAGCRLRGRD